MRLKNRQKAIPGGYRFYDAALKWTAPRWASFDAICRGLKTARLANPALVKQYHLATTQAAIEEEVDYFNAKVCSTNGWTDYIIGVDGGTPPAPFPTTPQLPLAARLKNVAGGSKILVKWIDNGAEAVASEVAAGRAAVCAGCPLNGKGDFTRWFTVPVSEAIRAELNRRRDMALSTPHDDNLGVCEACLCPLKLKVHLPLHRITEEMSPETKGALHQSCWVRSEMEKCTTAQ